MIRLFKELKPNDKNIQISIEADDTSISLTHNEFRVLNLIKINEEKDRWWKNGQCR